MRVHWNSPGVIALLTLGASVLAWWYFGSQPEATATTGPAAAATVAAIGAIFNGAVQWSRTAASQRAGFLLRLHDGFFFRPEMARIRRAIDAETLTIQIPGLRPPPDDPPYD